jgi:hypothetical protein
MRNVSHKSCRKNPNTHVMLNNFLRISCRLWDNVEKYCRTGQVTDDEMAHAHCMPDNWVYKHTLKICNTYCFCTGTIVARTRLSVTFIPTLSLLFCNDVDSSAWHKIMMNYINVKFYVQYSVHHGSIYQEINNRCHVTVLYFLLILYIFRTHSVSETCRELTGNKVLWRDICWLFLDKLYQCS